MKKLTSDEVNMIEGGCYCYCATDKPTCEKGKWNCDSKYCCDYVGPANNLTDCGYICANVYICCCDLNPP